MGDLDTKLFLQIKTEHYLLIENDIYTNSAENFFRDNEAAHIPLGTQQHLIVSPLVLRARTPIMHFRLSSLNLNSCP